MRFVLAALSRPITVVVALVAIALFAFLAVQRMPVDIFPKVGEPAIYVAQPYGGMDPAQMEGYLTYYYEYHFLYITGIDRVESKSIQGAALMKLIFHEGTDMASGDGGDGWLRQPRPRLHAARDGAALHHAIRRRAALPSVNWSSAAQHAFARRVAGFRAQPRAALVCDTARCFRSAALRRQPADDRHNARSRQAAAISDLAAGGDLGGQQGHAGDALRKYVDRRDQPHCKDQRSAGRQSFGTAEHAHPAGLRDNDLPAETSEPLRTARTSLRPTLTSTAREPSTSP